MIGKLLLCILMAVYYTTYNCDTRIVYTRPERNFDQCDVYLDKTSCIQYANCHKNLNLRDDPESTTCQNHINCYNGNFLPLSISFKGEAENIDKGFTLLQMLNSDRILCPTVDLDLSYNNVEVLPALNELRNLKLLNVSNNVIDSIELSNSYNLVSLNQIDFSYNKIKEIHQSSENKYPYKMLQKLWLSHNELLNIPDNIFLESSNLIYLDLSFNHITNLNQMTFRGLEKLLTLQLSYNEISDINSSLYRFDKLKKLYLKGNKIQNVVVRDFDTLNELEILDLSENLIMSVEKNVFKNMLFLKEIDLSFNQITSIDKYIFSINNNLQRVDLTENEISQLPTLVFLNKSLSYFSIKDNILEGSLKRGIFEGLRFITKLDLSYQRITHVEDNAFFGLENLSELILNNNHIQIIFHKSFKTLQKLILLDLSFNEITEIEFDKVDLLSLQTLILHGNHISKVQKNNLHDLTILQFLDLSNNNLTHIEVQSFTTLTSVKSFSVSKNPINGSLEAYTFKGLNFVPILDLTFTELNAVQNHSFDSMFQLFELNISHSKVTELEYNSFTNTGNINIIDISHNQLKTFYVNTTHLINLKQLILNNNRIKILHQDFVKSVVFLNIINLSNNLIDIIDFKHFEDQKHLQYVDLSHNSNITIDFSFLKESKELETLILSHTSKEASFKNIGDISLRKLELSHSNIQNISKINLNSMKKLQYLKVCNNNLTQLVVGSFTNLTYLNVIDVSYNQINVIQPGVFEHNFLLKTLNISHNVIFELSYGALHGLISLNILDISYNRLDSLETARFVEVVTLKELIVDHNRITDVSVEDFHRTSLEILSIGDNPLPCSTIIKLKSFSYSFNITALRKVRALEENAYGIKCSKRNNQKHFIKTTKDDPKTSNIDENVLNELRDLLSFLKTEKITEGDKNMNNRENFNMTEILENSRSIIVDSLKKSNNLTSQLNEEQKHTNILLEKISKLVLATTTLNRTQNEWLESMKNSNSSDILNKMKQHMENVMFLEKEKILNEMDSKLLSLNKRLEPLFTTSVPNNEKLLVSTESTPSIFVNTCIALILFILVALTLFKIYKSRRNILRRRSISISTREIANAMDNSNL